MDIEIYYDDGAVVLGAEGSRDAEDAGAVGNGAVVARVGTEDAGT